MRINSYFPILKFSSAAFVEHIPKAYFSTKNGSIFYHHSLAMQKDSDERKFTPVSENDNSNSQAALMDFFESIGNPSPFVMAPMVNPTLLGANQYWPGRPAWRAIIVEGKEVDDDKGGGIVYASDGLTQPWDDEVWNDVVDQRRKEKIKSTPNVGLGFEVIMGSIDLPDSIVREIVMAVSNNMSEKPFQMLPFFESMREDELFIMKEFEWLSRAEGNDDKSNIILGTMSTEVFCDDFPEEYKSETGTVGILIDGGVSVGLPLTFPLLPATITTSGKEGGEAVEAHVRELIVLHPEELGHIIACGLPARMEIARRIRALKTKWCSSASRPSVVPVPPPLPGMYRSKKEICAAVEAWPPSLN